LIVLVLVALIFGAGPASARDNTTLAEAAERVRAAKMRDAALRSIDAAIALLEEESPTPRTQALEMLDHADRHRMRTDSQQLLRTRERERLQRGFREQLAAFARERAGELPPGWVDDVMTQEASRVETTIDRLLASKFDERYEEARRRAVRVQRGQLDDVLYPDAADIEALAGTPDSFVAMRAEAIDRVVTTGNGQALVDEYVAAISSESVLFEENEAVLEKRVGGAIKDALVLLWRQLRLASRAEPEDARERSVIATQILDDLTRLAAEAERVNGTSYGVFPSAEIFAVDRAEQLETRSFLTFLKAQLDSAVGCPALPQARVLEHVSSSYTQVPPLLAAHEEQLQAALLAPTRQGIVEDYAASVPDATARVALRRRLEEQRDTDPAVQQVFGIAFTRCLRTPLTQRRVELAQEELAAQEPGIADFSFELADGGLRWLEIHRLDAPDGPFPPADGLRMEEARATYRAHREQLAAEAKDVLWRQKALTRDPERKASFVEQITADGDRSEERKAYWQEAYENSVLAAWGGVRTEELLKGDEGLPRHPHKYDRVFGPVSDIIEEIITLEYGKTTQIVTQVDASQSPAGQATGQAATHEASTTEIAPTVGTAVNPVASGGAGGPATGPATGESPNEQEGGQLARAEGPTTQTSSGGGGGGSGPDCAALLERCSLASGACYEALNACKNDPATCADGLARCRDMMEQCEQGREPLVPEGQARYRIDEGAGSAPCLASIGFPMSAASQ
jgi:hypothetical protein